MVQSQGPPVCFSELRETAKEWRGGAAGANRTRRHLLWAANGQKLFRNRGKIQIARN